MGLIRRAVGLPKTVKFGNQKFEIAEEVKKTKKGISLKGLSQKALSFGKTAVKASFKFGQVVAKGASGVGKRQEAFDIGTKPKKRK